MYISDTHLKSFLADAGLVSQKDFAAAETEAKESGRPVGEILTSHNTIGEDELRRTYAYILGIPFVSLAGTKIKYEVLSLIPELVSVSRSKMFGLCIDDRKSLYGISS